MSLALVHSRARVGVHAPEVRVEVLLSGGLPSTQIVGLPEAAVRESRERVRAALLCAQFEFPARRITINLAPADLPKEGGRFDLPIALGILAASGQIDRQAMADYEFLGELALTGELRGVDGVLPAALAAAQAGRRLIVPLANGAEAAIAGHVEAFTARTLLEVCATLNGSQKAPAAELAMQAPGARALPDMADVRATARTSRAGDRRCRWAPSVAGRQPWLRQDPAGLAPARSIARGQRSRSTGNRCNHLDQRPWAGSGPLAATAVPRPAPHRQRSGAGRRRHASAPRRDLAVSQRRAVPGRIARVATANPGSVARALGVGRGHHRTRGTQCGFSGALSIGRSHESMPVRLGRRWQRALPLQQR